MDRQQLRDLVRLIPEGRLADFTVESLRIGCSPERTPRQQLEDLLLAQECIEHLIVRAMRAAEHAQAAGGLAISPACAVEGD